MWQLAYFAGFFAALALLVAAGAWWRVAKEGSREPTDQQPVLGVRRVRAAASATVIAMGLLGVALLAAILERLG